MRQFIAGQKVNVFGPLRLRLNPAPAFAWRPFRPDITAWLRGVGAA